ncbi:hypothetical protein BCR33DRAFT_772271 [Rhizoclosmatium globosum]|uniref:Uncharacterized protein n=1 Tax=Rhizoclosmatium globosum TaxID=329046 RepID=A0A1Y2B6D7_9FUNG|nr:hypothetical protein BCR33DRAFT_772271 [Rhizoclosmatium globosum]|eukprot:ORY30100.1 hypothetical protein BCR33DRAFT_772271 [Rhizoclosmatium globosum]
MDATDTNSSDNSLLQFVEKLVSEAEEVHHESFEESHQSETHLLVHHNQFQPIPTNQKPGLLELFRTKATRLSQSNSSLETAANVAATANAVLKSDALIIKRQNTELRNRLKRARSFVSEISNLEKQRLREPATRVVGEVEWTPQLDAAVLNKSGYDGVMKDWKAKASSLASVGTATDSSTNHTEINEYIQAGINTLTKNPTTPELSIGGRFFRPSISFDGSGIVNPSPSSATTTSTTTPSATVKNPSAKRQRTNSGKNSSTDTNKLVLLESMAVLSTARVTALKQQYEIIKKEKDEREQKYKRLLDLCDGSKYNENGPSLDALLKIVFRPEK